MQGRGLPPLTTWRAACPLMPHEAAQWLQHCSAVAASQRQSSLFGGFSLNELPKQAGGGVSRQLGRAHLPLALGLTLTQWPGNKGPAAKTWMVRKASPLLSWLGFLVLTAPLWNHHSDELSLRFSPLVRLSFI